MSTLPLRHYVILRKDLPFGVQAAQCVHAAGESTRGVPLPDGTYAVALHVSSESELLEIHKKLKTARIPHRLVREPDEPYKGQAMAIGVHPFYGKESRKLLSNLPLVK